MKILYILLLLSLSFSQNLLSLSDNGDGIWNVNYDGNISSLGHFEFTVEGVSEISTFGGDSEEAGWTITINPPNKIIGHMSGWNTITPTGILINLIVEGIPTCLSEIYFLDFAGTPVNYIFDGSCNINGCTDPEACNYDETATADDGSCAYEYDCAGDCGGDLEWDCAGICGGDNSSYDGCCGLPPNDDCTDDCVTDDLGQCCTPQDVDGCGICFGDGDGTDCNDDGIPDDCEEVYDEGYDLGNAEGYTAGLEEGILLGGQSGDANGDGTLDILDIVYFIDVILNP